MGVLIAIAALTLPTQEELIQHHYSKSSYEHTMDWVWLRFDYYWAERRMCYPPGK